jgi:hypothetical protein
VPFADAFYLSLIFSFRFSLLRPKSLVAKYNAGSTLSASGSASSLGSLSVVSPKEQLSEYDPVADLIDTIRMLIAHTLVCPPASVRDLFSDDTGNLLVRTAGTVAAIAGRGSATPPPQHIGLVRRLERARNRRNLSEFVSAVNDFNREYGRCKRDGYVIGYTKKRYLDLMY